MPKWVWHTNTKLRNTRVETMLTNYTKVCAFIKTNTGPTEDLRCLEKLAAPHFSQVKTMLVAMHMMTEQS